MAIERKSDYMRKGGSLRILDPQEENTCVKGVAYSNKKTVYPLMNKA